MEVMTATASAPFALGHLGEPHGLAGRLGAVPAMSGTRLRICATDSATTAVSHPSARA